MQNKFIYRFLIFLATITFLSLRMNAQEFIFSLTGDPIDITGWNLGGDATAVDDRIDLTSSTMSQNGFVFYETPQSLSANCSYFTMEFDFRISSTSAIPADGLAFWYITNPPSGFELGAGLGMPLSMNGFALIIDVYDNDATPNNPLITLRKFEHTGYVEGTTTGMIGTELNNQTFVVDGEWHKVKLVYSAGVMSLYIDDMDDVLIFGDIALDDMTGYFGFSASTGAFVETHSIKNAFIKGIDAPPALDTSWLYLCKDEELEAYDVNPTIENGRIVWYENEDSDTPLEEAPVPNTTITDTLIYYVAQTPVNCDLESERVPFYVIVRESSMITIHGGDSVTICSGGTFPVNATLNVPLDENIQVRWTPIEGVDEPASLSPNITPMIKGWYVATATDLLTECFSADSIYIDLLPMTIGLINNDTIVCENTLMHILVGAHEKYNIVWSSDDGIAIPNAHVTTLFATHSRMVNVTATAPYYGCSELNDSFYIEVQPIPHVALGDDRIICAYDTAQLLATITPSWYTDYSIEWSPSEFLDASDIINPVYHNLNSSWLYTTVTTPIGCSTVDSILITVHSDMFLTLNVSDTGICEGSELILEAKGANEYRWIPTLSFSNDSGRTSVLKPHYTDQYYLLGFNETECVDTIAFHVEVYPNVTTNLKDTMTVELGENAIIELNSNAHYFSWFPSDGLSDPFIANPIASPKVRTRYFVTATSEYGCSFIDSIDVLVDDGVEVNVPNVFVPNSNNTPNNILTPFIKGRVSYYKFVIYNRWGNQVFESNDINKGWDGTYEGKPLSASTYIYTIQMQFDNGKNIDKNGSISLIR